MASEIKFLKEDKLDEIIEAINKHDWVEAYIKVTEWENLIEGILLRDYGEPNTIDEDIIRLKMLLNRRMPANIKKKRAREQIAVILQKLSKYGLYMAPLNGNLNMPDIAMRLSALLKSLDRLMLEIIGWSLIPGSVIPQLKAIAPKTSPIFRLKAKLDYMEQLIRIIDTDDPAVQEVAQVCLTNLSVMRADLLVIMGDKDKKVSSDFRNAYATLYSNVNKLVDMLSRDRVRREAAKRIFETVTNIQLSSFSESEVEEVIERGPTLEPIKFEFTGSEFDWVDREWEDLLTKPNIEKLILIYGHNNTGKSALGHAILEYYAKKHGLRAYLFNTSGRPLSEKKLKSLPSWIHVVDDPDEVKPNSVVLVDEAYGTAHARTTQGYVAIELDKFLELRRHKNCTIIYVTQQTSKIDRNIIGAVDVLLVKPLTDFRLRFEREEVKDYSRKAFKAFNDLIRRGEMNLKEWVYAFSLNLECQFKEGLKKNGLASYWNEEISRLYE